MRDPLACSRLRDSGGKSFINTFPLRISLLIRSHYVYYLRAWHRLVILLYTRLFWRFCHVVTSIYFWLISWVRRPNLAIVILRNKVGGGYENVTSLKVNSICFKLYRTYSNRTLLICQMLANLFWGLILKDCIAVQEKKKKVLVFCWRSPQNVNLGPILTSPSCSDSKEMYKKAWCTCKVVVC